ncbi:ATP-binding protein [Brotaphodocola sp.]|uniref:ATP-binding protein n=1 Tax=Brotaphodocola sp. TaxID=3073577 RepID=UPI003D7D7AD9
MQNLNGWGKKHITELVSFILIVLLSLAMVVACLTFYRRYRDSMIRTEESQLLTIAGVIGNNLSSYLNSELKQIDLYYEDFDDSESRFGDSSQIEDQKEDQNEDQDKEQVEPPIESAEESQIALLAKSSETELKIRRQTGYFLKESEGLYDQILLDTPSGATYSYLTDHTEIQSSSSSARAEIEEAKRTSGEMTDQRGNLQAEIVGKQLSDQTGWYEMKIAKKIVTQEGEYVLLFSMDLHRIYQKIVEPVKIGENGYSVVKDQNLDIIMHHAQDQIGMDAVKGRSLRYPSLNLTSLDSWVERQTKEDSGTGILDSYVWDDPSLPAVRRIVAFTVIYIQGERWIVNSTLPMEELDSPLNRMMVVLVGIVMFYILVLVFATRMILKNRFLAVSQQKEISYLKEINQGMELLARKNDEIRHYQRIQSLGMMASHIAHEFNNYLTPVLIYSELLESDESISEENKEMIREITRSVDKASNLSRELLAFSRQDMGVRLEKLDFTEETNSALMVVRQLVPSAITFRAEITQESLFIWGRRGMAEHILMNLCKNAFQAMEHSEKKILTVSLRREAGNMICLRVSDTGCGISESARQQIFEPFYTTKGSRQGTGLGLSVVQNMIRSVDGRIEVKSAPDQGTCFELYIPEYQADPESDQKKDKDGRKRLKSVSRIAIVSADEMLRKMKGQARGSRYSIDLYEHPAVLIDKVQKNPELYEMVIADYMIPMMNGIELCEILRRVNPEIRLILTSDQVETDFEWYRNNGMIDRFMTKTEFQEDFQHILQENCKPM